MRSSRRAVLPWLLLVASALPAARARAEPPPPVEIPSGFPVSLDGDPLRGEWEDASTWSMGPSGPVLRAKQVRATLLLCLETDRPWPSKAQLTLVARPGPGDDRVGEAGTFRLDYDAVEHNRPHAIATRRTEGGWVREDARVVVRAARLTTTASIEAAIPLALLGVGGKEPTELRWFVQWVDATKRPSYVTFPTGLDLGGTNPDLKTAARWARTTTWNRADGAGAFPSTGWDAWVAADREMTRRGEAAHALALRLREDDPAPGAPEPSKKDAPVETEVLENLRWIAQREPLTPTDLRAMATGLWRLNRYEAALAVLDADALGRADWNSAETAYLRAQVAQDGERFDDAAVAWETVAAAGVPSAAAYREMGRVARERLAALERERAARREDETKDLPLALVRTSKGEMLWRLLEDDVPKAVAQFVHLAESRDAQGRGFYDATLFHRVRPSRFAQGGDPKSRDGCEAAGDGGSDWAVDAETNARHGFFRGAVGFATKGDRKNRSQFFVVTGHPQTDLAAQGFTCFATVVAGQEVADRLEACDALHSIAILRKRDHPYDPRPK